MKAEAKKAIANFRDGDHKDWTKVPTSVQGVFIVYMPLGKGETERSLGIEFNPVDDQGNPTKRRGIFLKSADLAQLKAAANSATVEDLVNHIESENPASPSGSTGEVITI